METNEIIKSFKSKIDSIVYTDNPKTYKVPNIITFDWKSVLPPPPSNTSEITLRELRYLSNITQNLDSKQKMLVELVDKEPIDLFQPILKKYKLKFDISDFKKVWKVAYPVVMNTKYHFNRARPRQIADYFGIKINEIQSKTTKTPSYPSGHTCYTALCTYLLADMHPEYSSLFFSKVGVAGFARCLQGVHYPSDNEAAMTLSGVIWENIKHEMFPNLYPVEQAETYLPGGLIS